MIYDESKLSTLSTNELNRMVAERALSVQDACNLSGIAFSFSPFMQLICELSHRDENKGTEFKNRHPAVIMYVSKLSSLCGSEDSAEFGRAYDWCIKQTEPIREAVEA